MASTGSVTISKADIDRLQKEHKDFRSDAAVVRAVLTAAEAGLGLMTMSASSMGMFGDDSLVRLFTFIGGAAVTADAARRGKSILDMYRS